MGIMNEIKGHLESGKTVKELKELGFKAPSIYKVKKSLEVSKPPEPPENSEPQDPPKLFQKEDKEIPETVLETNNIEPFLAVPVNPVNSLDNQEEEEEGEPLIEELFGDDDQPFRDFDEVDINRDHIDIIPGNSLSELKTKTSQDQGTGKLGVAELITQVYSLIGITTGHNHWDVSPKEQKVLKHLCKIPVLEAALHKFGLYGCVISLITMTLKRIKIEMQLKNTSVEKDQGNRPEPIIRLDSPANVLDTIGVE